MKTCATCVFMGSVPIGATRTCLVTGKQTLPDARACEEWEAPKSTVHIFPCGTQWLDWETRNCCNCKNSINQKETVEAPFLCDIEQALNIASIDGGMVPEDIAKRAGYDPAAYTWACPEIEYTDEWKRERFEEEHQERLFKNNWSEIAQDSGLPCGIVACPKCGKVISGYLAPDLVCVCGYKFFERKEES